MTDSSRLQRKLSSARELRTVVRTMKAVAASNITQYEQAVLGLTDYVRTMELGLRACLRTRTASAPRRRAAPPLHAVVFGSDQGLVGQFNESIADHAVAALAGQERVEAWAVGDRVQNRLADAGLSLAGAFPVPASVHGIGELVAQILLQTQTAALPGEQAQLVVFHNRPTAAAGYAPVSQRLLPLDETWREERVKQTWPGRRHPQIMGTGISMLRALIGEYLFASLFRAGAESLASEQASRLAAMQRAERSIEDMLTALGEAFHRLRQSQIDEELFDVVSGFEALQPQVSARTGQPDGQQPAQSVLQLSLERAE